jgi:hypothetical protein
MSCVFALPVLLSWEGTDNKISETGREIHAHTSFPTWKIHEYANRDGNENYVRNERELHNLTFSIMWSKSTKKRRDNEVN